MRFVLGVLLVLGTSLGGGMLALPVVTAAGGYTHALFFLLGIWALTLFTALLLLEVNLWLPQDAHLMRMAQQTLGWPGQWIASVFYLLFLYCLLSAYVAGGGDWVDTLLGAAHIALPHAVSVFIFSFVFAVLIFFDVRVVAWANWGFMMIKLFAYFALVILMLPHVQLAFLRGGQSHTLLPAMIMMVTAFGYSIIIPSLRRYFDSDVRLLKRAIIVGSLAALACYLLWDFAVQGSLRRDLLIHLAKSGHVIGEFPMVLKAALTSGWALTFAILFVSICVTTAALSIGLSLSDLIADICQAKGHVGARLGVLLLTFLPPCVVVWWRPSLFIAGLHYAGLACVVLMLVLPTLMVWRGRYHLGLSGPYCVPGGKVMLWVSLSASVALLCVG
jgi:tyrosine-specific transport protein